MAVGSGEYEYADVAVDDGVVLVESDAPFGLISDGFDHKVSYAYPGGLGARSD